jgi:hypothetical protein
MSAPRKPLAPQAVLALALAALALYYALVFRPMAEKERSLAAPFEAMKTRLRLAATNNPALSGLSDETLVRIEEALQRSLTNVARARGQVIQRHAPDTAISLQIVRPFQLIDYQNERLKRRDHLVNLGAKNKVKLAAAVPAGLPEFTVENPNPELLWGQLAVADGAVRAAIQAGLISVENVAVLAPVAHAPTPSAQHRLVELPVRLEAVGGFDALSRFLALTLLEAKEREALGLPAIDGLPGLTLQHIFVRKEGGAGPATVRLTVELRGFLRLPIPESP